MEKILRDWAEFSNLNLLTVREEGEKFIVITLDELSISMDNLRWLTHELEYNRTGWEIFSIDAYGVELEIWLSWS